MTLRSVALVALVAAACVLATASNARTFIVLSTIRDSWTVLDPSAVESLPGGVVRRATTVTVQRHIVEADGQGSQPGYVRTVSDYDCTRQEMRWLRVDAFARDGSLLVSQRNNAAGWKSVAASAETQAAFRAVCTLSGNQNVLSADSIGSVVSALMASWDPLPAARQGAPRAKAARP